MKSLLVSFLALLLLIGCWLGFYHYSDRELHQMVSACETEVMPAIESGQWDTAYDMFQDQYENWHKYQKWAYLMLETEKINETDLAFAKTLMYIKARDLSNSSGELLSLEENLRFLHKNEGISLANIL